MILTPAGDDRPDRGPPSSSRPYAKSTASRCWRAGWAGADVAAGEAILNRGGHPDVRLPRHRRPRRSTYMWRSATTSAASTRPRRCRRGRRRDRRPARRPRRSSPPRARRAGRCSPRSSRRSCSPPTASRPSPTRRRATDETRPSRPPSAIGYPVVLKLHSRDDHAQDRRRRRASSTCADAEAVGRAFRAIETSVAASGPAPAHFQGVTVQPMVRRDGLRADRRAAASTRSSGRCCSSARAGQLVEVFKDRALALPPLNTTLARRMMEQTTDLRRRSQGVRGRRPVDLAALEQLLVRFSQLVVEQPWIQEIDINPLLASARRPARAGRPRLLHDPVDAGRAAAAARRSALPDRSTSCPVTCRDGTERH